MSENITLRERTCMKQTSKISAFIMKFYEIINKIVIQDGGPDAILNISVDRKTTFMKI